MIIIQWKALRRLSWSQMVLVTWVPPLRVSTWVALHKSFHFTEPHLFNRNSTIYCLGSPKDSLDHVKIQKHKRCSVYSESVSHSCVWPCNPVDCSPWDFPGKNTGVGFHSIPFLQGILPGLLHCTVSSPFEPPGKPQCIAVVIIKHAQITLEAYHWFPHNSQADYSEPKKEPLASLHFAFKTISSFLWYYFD